MRKLLTGIALLSVLACAGTSEAANGTLSMTWDSCTGIVDKPSGGAIAYSLYMSEIGVDQPHKAYEVRVIYGDVNQLVPDSWRFDAAGCQTSSGITIDHLAPSAVSKVCPSFMQTSAPSLQIKDVGFVPPSDPYASTLMRVVCANSYPNGVVSASGVQRYFLERILFDHTFSVVGPGTPGTDCGGFERPICIKVSRAAWLDLNGIETDFDRPTVTSATFVDATACPGVPVKPATWGKIKNQYRQ
jgi:hypothetical protein